MVLTISYEIFKIWSNVCKLCSSGGAISLMDHSKIVLNGSNFTQNKAQPLFEYNDTMLFGCPEGIICMISKNTIVNCF